MAIGIRVEDATRKRADRVCAEWNKRVARGWPSLSKTQLYQALINWGCSEYERMLGLAPPKGADEFSAGGPAPFEVTRRKVGQLPRSSPRQRPRKRR